MYSWRGADIQYIRRFARDFPNVARIRLEENFRSTSHILDAANAVIAQDKTRLGKTLFTRKPIGDRIEVVAFRNAEAEATGLVAEMKRRHAEGLSWSDMALLYRSNALSRGFEEALMRARVPYVLVRDVGFYQRAEIKDTLAFLRLCATPDDTQADEASGGSSTSRRAASAKAMQELEDEAAFRRSPLLVALETAELSPKARSAGLAFLDAICSVSKDASTTVADQISLLLDVTGYRAMLSKSRAETTEGRLENVQELIQLAGDFHTACELLDHASLTTGGPNEDDADRVRLMTLHKGKGLEFPHVFLPASEASSFPLGYGDAAEERRLAYVAITRGMRRVTISHCEFRRGYTSPSCFVAEIPDRHKVRGWLRGPTEFAGRRSGPIPRLNHASAAILRHM